MVAATRLPSAELYAAFVVAYGGAAHALISADSKPSANNLYIMCSGTVLIHYGPAARRRM
jgi:hypothetical protein